MVGPALACLLTMMVQVAGPAWALPPSTYVPSLEFANEQFDQALQEVHSALQQVPGDPNAPGYAEAVAEYQAIAGAWSDYFVAFPVPEGDDALAERIEYIKQRAVAMAIRFRDDDGEVRICDIAAGFSFYDPFLDRCRPGWAIPGEGFGFGDAPIGGPDIAFGIGPAIPLAGVPLGGFGQEGILAPGIAISVGGGFDVLAAERVKIVAFAEALARFHRVVNLANVAPPGPTVPATGNFSVIGLVGGVGFEVPIGDRWAAGFDIFAGPAFVNFQLNSGGGVTATGLTSLAGIGVGIARCLNGGLKITGGIAVSRIGGGVPGLTNTNVPFTTGPTTEAVIAIDITRSLSGPVGFAATETALDCDYFEAVEGAGQPAGINDF